MSGLFLRVEAANGLEIVAVLGSMIVLANQASAALRFDVGVACDINGVNMRVHPGDTLEDAQRLYRLLRECVEREKPAGEGEG